MLKTILQLRVIHTCLVLIYVLFTSCTSKVVKTDILIIGGGASGTAAAIQAARLGANVVIIEETPWLGGMLTSAGVSAIDGNRRMPSGIFGEFRNKLADYYGGLDSLHTGWVSSILFEPSVGDRILKSMVKPYDNILIFYNAKLNKIIPNGSNWIGSIVDSQGKLFSIEANILIDGTELGDVASAVGVPYSIGMESRDVTGEDVAPSQANGIIQDITMVATLKDFGRDVTIPEPDGYDPDEFACTCINSNCVSPKEPDRMWSPEKMITYGKLPNGKYMINWPIEGNDYYVNLIEMTPEEREDAIQEAKDHTMRYVYFLQHELGYNTLGLADDEYPTEDHLPFYPYHRESRRIHGKVRFNLNHIISPYATIDPLYRTAIAVGDYPVDHHHQAYDGAEELPNLYFHPVPSFGLPLGVIMPDDYENLLVTEKSISVSNIANGATRLQPVVMQIGQAAGAVAAIAVQRDISTGEVSVREVQRALLDADCYLLPFIDIDREDKNFKTYQRVGVAGLLQGEGESIEWSNETWLRINDTMMSDDLQPLYNLFNLDFNTESMNVPVTINMLSQIDGLEINVEKIKKLTGITKSVDMPLTRGEYAIIIDRMFDPFNAYDVNIKGEFIH